MNSVRIRIAALVALAVAVVVVVVLLVSGGGGDNGSGPSGGNENGDPATVAPASSLAYATAYVRPTGPNAASVDRLLQKLLGTQDTGGRVRTLGALALGRNLTPDDIEPWLGRRAGVAFTSLGGAGAGAAGGAAGALPGAGSAQAALIVASKDDGKAQDALDKARDASPDKETEKSFEGVDYAVNSRGEASALVGHFVVLGTERAVRSVIDGSKGRSLATSLAYRRALGARAAGSLGAFFVDVPRVVRAIRAARPLSPDNEQAVDALLGATSLGPLSGLVEPTPTGLRMDASMLLGGDAGRNINASAAAFLASMPTDSWLAAGFSGAGAAVGAAVDAAVGGGLFGGAIRFGVEQRIKSSTGLDLNNDVIDALGDLGVFGRGVRPAQSGVGAVVRSRKPDVLEDAVPRYAGFLGTQRPGLTPTDVPVPGGGKGVSLTSPAMKVPIVLLARGDRGVAASGLATARAGLSPGEGVGSTPGFRAARSKLAGVPMLAYLSIEPLVARAKAGGASRSQDFRLAEQALRKLGFGVVGVRRAGERLVFTGFLELKK
jgi:hypothetical protein